MPIHRTLVAVIASSLTLIGCNKQPPEPAAEPAAPAAPEESAAPQAEAAETAEAMDPEQALSDEIGVEPGGFIVDDGVGAEAVVAEREGALEVRRVGEEAFAEVAADADVALYSGDQLQTGDGGHASVMLADGSTVDVAEDSTIAIGDRDADSDPAVSVAVLVGVARFQVSPRAEGEGPFLVFTPSGVADAQGTTFVVGVAATGSVRIGVEEGGVDVTGSADFTQSAELSANKSVSLDLGGSLSTVATLEGEWGTWRAEAEAQAQPAAVIEAQLQGATAAEAQLDAGYEQLEELTADAERADTEAAALEASADAETYEATAAARANRVEAPFAASLRLQQLSFAMLARAHVAQQLALRHPELAAKYEPKKDVVARAVLCQKKFHVATRTHLRPLRAAYYRHHPRGRRHAKAAGVEVPAFFAKVKLKEGEAEDAPKLAVYRPRRPSKVDKKRKLEPNGPAVGWQEKAKARAAKAKAWYELAEERRASLLLHGKPEKPAETVLKPHPPKRREQVALAWGRAKAHPGRHLGLAKQAERAAEAETPEAAQAPAVNPAGHVLPAQAEAVGNRERTAEAPGAQAREAHAAKPARPLVRAAVRAKLEEAKARAEERREGAKPEAQAKGPKPGAPAAKANAAGKLEAKLGGEGAGKAATRAKGKVEAKLGGHAAGEGKPGKQ